MTAETLARLILVLLCAEFLLERLAALLTERRRHRPMPEEFRDRITEEEYDKSRRYGSARHGLGRLRAVVSLAALLLFWQWGGFPWLQETVAGISSHWLWQGLLFLGLLSLGQQVLDLPFDLVQTFRIDQRFGMNTTTAATFLSDRLKGLLLMLLIGAPVLGGVLACFRLLGESAWLWGWLVLGSFTLLLAYVAPTWILPLFNRFEPLPDGELRSSLLELAREAGFPVSEILVADGSRRSRMSNAYLAGFGARRRIVLYDTLLDSQGHEEIRSVLAHELGHFRLGHIRQRLLLSLGSMGLLLYLFSLGVSHPTLAAAFGMNDAQLHAGFAFCMILFGPVNLLLGVIQNAVSRRHEYQADAFAAGLIRNGDTLVSALKTLYRENLATLDLHPLAEVLHADHPAALNRIRALRAVDAQAQA